MARLMDRRVLGANQQEIRSNNSERGKVYHMMRWKYAAVSAFALAFVLGLGLAAAPAHAVLEDGQAPNTLTEEQEAEGWRLLFDGEDPARHWRGYNRDDLPAGWQVDEDGWLVLADTDAGGDIITLEEFDDFDLFMEWKISDGGNSGIFYFAQEVSGSIWHSAPEYQILDNDPDTNPIQAAGALYDLVGPEEDVTNPAGEINTARIIKNGSQLEHYMNGELLLSIEVHGDTWNHLVENSKFDEHPFAETDEGHIGLQDHGDWVAYRSIMIRELDEE